MLKSMSDFGRAEQAASGNTLLMDRKSLYSKEFEVQVKLPSCLRPFGFDIRKILS